MFGIILASRGSPARCRRPDVERNILFPRTDTTGPEDLVGPAAASPRVRQAGGRLARAADFPPKSDGPGRPIRRNAARRLLAADLTDVAHPSFDDPSARRDPRSLTRDRNPGLDRLP